MIHRRGLITGLASLIAAPAIVRASLLMPIKQMLWPQYGFSFLAVSSLDHITAATGLHFRARVSKDGRYPTDITGPIKELGNGMYYCTLNDDEMDANDLFFQFIADGADPTYTLRYPRPVEGGGRKLVGSR